MTVLNDDYASLLGFDLESLPVADIDVVGGETEGRDADLVFGVCGEWFLAPVIFCKDTDNLLGRIGVFDQLRIAFIDGARRVIADRHP